MEKRPKIKIFLFDSVPAALISAATYILADIVIEWKIIVILLLAIISLIITMFRFESKSNEIIKNQEKELLLLKKKHKAISTLFKQKNSTLKWYKKAWNDMNYHIAMLNSAKQSERISAMQEYYIKLSKEMPKEND